MPNTYEVTYEVTVTVHEEGDGHPTESEVERAIAALDNVVAVRAERK
jgi:hypothetical protein